MNAMAGGKCTGYDVAEYESTLNSTRKSLEQMEHFNCGYAIKLSGCIPANES